MNQHIELFLISAAPMLGIVVFLLVALLALRFRARGKSARMNRAEMLQTGMGTTTWDSYQGATTQGPLTVDPIDRPTRH